MDTEPKTSVAEISRTPQYYDNLLNPDKSLPGVVLKKIEPTGKGTFVSTIFMVKTLGGDHIGSFTLNTLSSPKEKPSAHLNTITIHEDFRGRGYGKSTYLEILKYLGDIKLKSGSALSRGSLPIWEWLVEKGVARKVTEGAIYENTENNNYSSAEFEVI